MGHRNLVDAVDARSQSLSCSHVFDDALLERAKQQWRYADWEELRSMDVETVRQHPHRARLALLAAAGFQQLGDLQRTRSHVDLALEWGCDTRLVSQVLVAGVLNLLGCAAVLAGQRDRAREHFEKAVRTADPNSNDKLIGHARAMREMVRRGLLSQAAVHLSEGVHEPNAARRGAAFAMAHRKVVDLEVEWLRDRVLQLQRRMDAAGHAAPIVGQPPAVVPAATAIQTAPSGQYFGLNGLDRKLKAYLDFDQGFFVELGANDGVAQSNTLYFERERRWRGVLIEPILHNFLRCKSNRAADNHFVCAACVSTEYAKSYVELTYANLMTTPIGLDSDIDDPKNHAEAGRIYMPPGESTVDVLATARTLGGILDEASAPASIDLLSLDVEGAELEVLKGVDHRQYRFRFMLIECRDPDRLTAYLADHGYALVDKLSKHDYLFAPR